MDHYSTYKDIVDNYYQTIQLNGEAIDYIYEKLRYGLMLSNLVSQIVPIRRGKAEVFVDNRISEREYTSFKKGRIGIAPPSAISTLPPEAEGWGIDPNFTFFVVPAIKNHLKKEEKNICIIEHIDPRPTSEFISEARDEGDPMFYFEDQGAYYYISAQNSSSKAIYDIFSLAHSWSQIILLTTLDAEISKAIRDNKIKQSAIENMAKETKKIIVSAYDGEGYLIWQHNEVPTILCT